VGARVERALPDFARETAMGIARGAGLDERAFLRGCTMPDALMWCTARMMQLRDPGPAMAHRLALGLGCTSAVAWGTATRDKRLYHGRNFDYHGVANWPAHATLIFHEPNAGHRYVSVAAAGVGLGGVTSMNEAGLSLTVHQHMFTDKTRLGGTPIGVVGDIVMRQASSLDEAEAILRAHTPIGCWTYIVTDGRKNQVLCFEENPDRRAARRLGPDGGTFGYANIYLDEALGATEVDLYGSYWRHNQGRHRRANELLRERSGSLDAAGIAAILADTGDPRCRIRDSIAMALTVGSVVFRPDDGALWVGTGEAPTSRTSFLPFSIARRGHAPELGELEMASAGDARADDAFAQYRMAYVAYVDDGDAAAARAHVERAAKLAPEQATYHSLLGLLSVEMGDAERARDAFDAAIALGHPDEERVAAFHLWRGRAFDLAGRRDAALGDYRVAIGKRADRPVHAAAKQGLRRPFDRSRTARMHIEMSLADVIHP
jgi:tetratricopeptide (TPR) repeat protein